MQPLRATAHSRQSAAARPSSASTTARKFRRHVEEPSGLAGDVRARRPKSAPCPRVRLLQSSRARVASRPSSAPQVMTVQNEGVRGFASWTTPAEILSVVHRRWTRGDLLTSRVTGEALFPLAVPLRRPHSSLIGDRYDELQRWIRTLERESRACRGFGYDICWVEVESRRAGRVRIPSAVVIPSMEDALQMIGKGTQAARFDTLAR